MDAWWWDMNTPERVASYEDDEFVDEKTEVKEGTPCNEEPEVNFTSNTTSMSDYVAPNTRQDDINRDFPEETLILGKVSTTSSTSSTSSSDSRPVATSLSDYRAPQINYNRDSHAQKLVAVIGREFDEPRRVSVELQNVAPSEADRKVATVKFVPFTVRRSVLIKGNFDWQELKQYDVICMCYNASEARILLTGHDGFYSSLLRSVEIFLGSNKVCFVITNHSLSEHLTSSSLISPQLQARLCNQSALQTYLDNHQVLSWFKKPSRAQAQRLLELAQLDPNPEKQTCVIL